MNYYLYTFFAGVIALTGVGAAFGAGAYATAYHYSGGQTAAAPTFKPLVLREELTAKAAVVIELESGQVLYQKNAYEPLPLASLTKLMSAEVVLSQKPLDTPVRITEAHLTPEGNSGLRAGATVRLGDLIRLGLVASSNDAMQAAASTLGKNGTEAMNAAAAELGLTKTHFRNPTGLDTSEHEAGAEGSAYDVAWLAIHFLKNHPDLFELTTAPAVVVAQNNQVLSAKATSLPLQSIPGFVAGKTGYTDLAGGNMVAIFDLEPGRPVAAVVLGSTYNGRFEDIKALIETARQNL